MRIVAGYYKGYKLQTFQGSDIRPTPDRVREAVFNIIGTKIVGAEFLDLFAGTGAIGIEAISRGAQGVTLVEIDKKAIALIQENLKKIRLNENINIIKMDCLQALKLLNLNKKRFDIIFLDPPYYKDNIFKILYEIDNSNILLEGALIIIQHSTREEIKMNFKKLVPFKEKKYGNTRITILEEHRKIF